MRPTHPGERSLPNVLPRRPTGSLPTVPGAGPSCLSSTRVRHGGFEKNLLGPGYIPFSAIRDGGCDFDGTVVRKGAVEPYATSSRQPEARGAEVREARRLDRPRRRDALAVSLSAEVSYHPFKDMGREG
jgi:hypothetical protein